MFRICTPKKEKEDGGGGGGGSKNCWPLRPDYNRLCIWELSISLITRANSNVRYGVILILSDYCEVPGNTSKSRNATQICVLHSANTRRSQNLDTAVGQENKAMHRGNLLDWSITDSSKNALPQL